MSDDVGSVSGEGVRDGEGEGRSPESAPVLRVVNPDATPEEIAALVAVFAALGSPPGAPAPRRTSSWAAPSRMLRQTHPHGPGGWQASGLPR